jgi:hypothetical protein
MFPVLAWLVFWLVLSVILPVVVLGNAMRTCVLLRRAA